MGLILWGRKDLINLCSERLNVAGEASEVGPSLGANKMFLQGLYMAAISCGKCFKNFCFSSLSFRRYGL